MNGWIIYSGTKILDKLFTYVLVSFYLDSSISAGSALIITISNDNEHPSIPWCRGGLLVHLQLENVRIQVNYSTDKYLCLSDLITISASDVLFSILGFFF